MYSCLTGAGGDNEKKRCKHLGQMPRQIFTSSSERSISGVKLDFTNPAKNVKYFDEKGSIDTYNVDSAKKLAPSKALNHILWKILQIHKNLLTSF